MGAPEQNWAAEITKWLGDRLEGGVLALSESSRENVIEALNQYTMSGVYKVPVPVLFPRLGLNEPAAWSLPSSAACACILRCMCLNPRLCAYARMSGHLWSMTLVHVGACVYVCLRLRLRLRLRVCVLWAARGQVSSGAHYQL